MFARSSRLFATIPTLARGGLCWAFLTLGCFVIAGCTEGLAHGLDETEANRVVVALLEHQIAAGKKQDPNHEGQFLVEVAQSDVATGLQVLGAAGLPAQRNPGVLAALGEGGLVNSPGVEQTKRYVGVAGDLERSLAELDSVLTARVHIAVPEAEPLGRDENSPHPTASVLLRHRGVTPPVSQSDVARLVAAAVPGLPTPSVVVVFASVPAPARTEAGLAALGPFTVGRSSVTSLRALLLFAGLLNVVLVATSALLWLRSKSSAKLKRGVETL
jgi:type III secretion protein J